MGEDRHKAVVKLSGESHAVKGLFVADASLFPSSVGVPPTLTVAALATHVCPSDNTVGSGLVPASWRKMNLTK